ncbi:MAG TPA: GH92 family glycosyl hydrolase [Verrucomicrobiae bacterium]|nr:GH92 family glycosyl hydrolase [Verrucomicrobiae bacterium]
MSSLLRLANTSIRAFAVLAFALSTSAQQNKEPVDYVNPNIGGIGQLLSATSPNVIMPYGMMRISPITTPGITDRYLADKIYGFPAGGMTLMPMTGSAETDPAKSASMYDHDLETVTPYYYAAILEKYDTRVEYTVSAHAAYYRLTFPAGAVAHVRFSVPQSGKIDLTNNTALTGSSGGGRGGRGGYFYAEFSRPVSSFRTLTNVPLSRGRGQGGSGGLGIMVDPSPDQARQVGIRIGISSISLDQACQNLHREIPAWDFNRAQAHARTTWNRALGKIRVKGGTEDQRTIFYTSLYRVLTSVSDVTEDGKYYGSFDQQVHAADGHGFYPIGAGAAMWGNYRSLEPLHLLLDPQEQVDLVRSFLTLYERTGRMMAINRGLSGHHIIAVALDAYMKGYRDFDVAKAYEAFKKMQMEETFLPWRDVPQTSLDRVYLEKGFFPALKKGEKETVKEVHPFERRQAVAVTLETAYDDWCMAEWAKALNKQEDYEYFWKRAHNYENVFDKRVGFMAPKSEDGNWVLDEKEYSPIWSGGQGGREYYTEMNGWIYTFHVQQDVAGLINLIGGRDKFVAKLDTLFQDQFEGFSGAPEPFRGGGSKYFFQAQFPDMTGLIGQYAQGNEPAFHIPYLYNYAGAPWMTQRRVRDIMKIWFDAGPRGISGDEDNGEESSWYVFSAMGFFTVCPGRPVYDIGSPIFEETRLTLAGGKVFTITARNVTAANKYIQSATINGKPLNKPWFEHSDMVNGGTLVLKMGPRPNTAWGSAPGASPPSMSH